MTPSPQKNIHKSFMPPKIFIVLNPPPPPPQKKIETQDFEPKTMVQAYVHVWKYQSTPWAVKLTFQNMKSSYKVS